MSQTKTYTVALSRWHTIANRLRGHGDALLDRAVSVLAHSSAQHELSDAQRIALADRGQKALADIAEARAALRGSTQVRAALAQANAQHGVTAKLAEAEGVRREIQQLEKLEAIDLLQRVSLDDVNAVLSKRTDGGGMLGSRAQAVSLALVGLDALDAHSRDKMLLDRQQQELMDEVNDLNRNTLSIDLDVEVAKNAGL